MGSVGVYKCGVSAGLAGGSQSECCIEGGTEGPLLSWGEHPLPGEQLPRSPRTDPTPALPLIHVMTLGKFKYALWASLLLPVKWE